MTYDYKPQFCCHIARGDMCYCRNQLMRLDGWRNDETAGWVFSFVCDKIAAWMHGQYLFHHPYPQDRVICALWHSVMLIEINKSHEYNHIFILIKLTCYSTSHFLVVFPLFCCDRSKYIWCPFLKIQECIFSLNV